MNFERFANHIEPLYYGWGGLNAYPRVPLPFIEVLDHVQAMTTPSTMQLINHAVRCMEPNECYLEVGTWRGGTLIGALLGNEARGIAIDNDTMDEHDKDTRSSQDVWRENVARFGMTTRTHYIDASVPEVWKHGLSALWGAAGIGVYLFDGDKSTTEAAYAGLDGVLPFLSRRALIFVDDANEVPIRRATSKLCATYPRNAFKILDIPTPGNCWPCFWNGIMAIAWQA